MLERSRHHAAGHGRLHLGSDRTSGRDQRLEDATGTHQGELMGIAATGKQATVTGLELHRFENGRVAESWINWDTLGLLQQIGAIPAPEAATA